jgi:hypothetical protein
VITPWVVPLIKIETPGMGCFVFSSNTWPLRVELITDLVCWDIKRLGDKIRLKPNRKK